MELNKRKQEINHDSLFSNKSHFRLGELGGNMGLFLGCSILTTYEFLDFLWELVLSKIRKRPVAVNTEPA